MGKGFKIPYTIYEAEGFMLKKSIKLICVLLTIIFVAAIAFGCKPEKDPNSDNNGETKKEEKAEILVNDSSYFHFSFDDTMKSLKHLTVDAQYKTIFEEPFFAYLKELHDKYGAKFSLYTYNDVIDKVSDKYKADFRANCSWLKLGLHSTSHKERFNNATYEQGFDAWNKFVKEAVRVTGTSLAIDRMPRLHYWQGTEEAMKGMRDATCGALGFLSSDHAYRSYYLTQPQHTYIFNHDYITDHKNGLTFVGTDLRIDWFTPNYKFTNTYKLPTEDTIYKELERRFTSPDFAGTLSAYLVFGHETNYYDGTKVSDAAKVWFSDICKFAYDNGIPFDYPQNRSYLATPYDIYE